MLTDFVCPHGRKRWFQGAAMQDGPWLGQLYSMATTVEMIPLRFAGLDYLMFFSDPLAEAGDDPAFVRETADAWAGGVIPGPDARLVKFFRADATADDDLFDPSQWPLRDRHGIFAFGGLLMAAVELHSKRLPAIRQYFYLPNGEALARFYGRIIHSYLRTRPALSFKPIIKQTDGGFYGYERP